MGYYSRDPYIKALKRRGLVNQESTLRLWDLGFRFEFVGLRLKG